MPASRASTSSGPSLGRGARARILAAAGSLFVDPGINATGIAELIAVARVSRRTLYQHFASKDDLIVAWLRELAADRSVAPLSVLSREDLTPRARLLEMFTTLGEGALRGDPFLAAAVELADPAHPARRVIARRQAELAETLGSVAREAGARDAERLGRRLLVLYAGAAAAVVAAGDDSAVADALAVARELLDDAIG